MKLDYGLIDSPREDKRNLKAKQESVILPENVRICSRTDLQRLTGARLGAGPLLDGARRRQTHLGVHAGVDVARRENKRFIFVEMIPHDWINFFEPIFFSRSFRDFQ